MFHPSVKYVSELYPSVSFEVKSVGVQLKREIEISLADNGLQQRLIKLEAQNLKINEVATVEDLSYESQKRIIELETQFQGLRAEEDIAWFKLTVLKISENDEDVSISTFLNYAPTNLFKEVMVKVREHLGLSEEQLGNSSSPTTLPPVVDGATERSSADTAGQTTSTTSEIAVNTTQS